MFRAGQQTKDSASIGFVGRLTDRSAAQPTDRVGRKNNPGLSGIIRHFGGHGVCLQPGHVLNERTSIGKAGIRRLVNVSGLNFELKSGSLEQVPPGGRSTG
jgi:hypothetical protein